MSAPRRPVAPTAPETTAAAEPTTAPEPTTAAEAAERPAARKPPERRGPRSKAGLMPGTPSLERSIDFRVSGLRLLRMMAPERALIAAVLAFAATGVALTVLSPWLLGRATDLIIRGATRPGGIDFAEIGQVLLVAIAAIAAGAGFSWLQMRLSAVIVQRMAHRLRESAQHKLSRLPLAYFDKQPRGEVLSRTTNDIDNITQTLAQAFGQMVRALLTLVGVLVMMFWISPLLALVALALVPVSALAATWIGKRAQPQFVRQWDVTGRLNAHVEEMYTGHTLVKVFGRQREAARTFAEHNEQLYQAAFRAQFISGVIQPVMAFLGNLNYVLVAVAGGLRVTSGALTIGDVQAFVQYSYQFNGPVSQIAAMANLLQSGVASAERVFDLLDAEEETPDPAGRAAAPAPTGRVTFENVSFRYEPAKPLIEDLSLTVEPGRTVAIVGSTGAGKTTLVNLLMRFYEVTGGRITIDGADIARMSRAELRGPIGMVLQDTWLFGGTIAENIAYGAGRLGNGADEVSRERVVRAAVATHADRFIRTLPDGYDTVIEDDGANLSAGEKQLVTIARAFLTDPAILILDEATSSVDTRTEVLIQRAMASLRQGRTSFVIAHRLSTIRDADVILVMESGRIVEQGTHTELLAAGGAYAGLYAAQFAHAPAS